MSKKGSMIVIKKIIAIFLLVTLAGCATTPPAKDFVHLKGRTYNIEGVSYIGVSSVINAYKVNASWDSVAKKLKLYRGDKEVILCAESDVALVNGRPNILPAPVRMHKSTMLVPEIFAGTAIARVFARELRIAKPYAGDELVPGCDFTIANIVVDAGHGGKDPGAIGKLGVREKYITLDIAKRLKSHLQKACIKAVLTRNDDRFISLWQRAHIANKLKADFFISIHANAARSSMAKGFEVFYLSEAVDDNARAIAAAENASLKYEDSSFGNRKTSDSLEATLWDLENTENRRESIELAKSIISATCKRLRMKDRGVKGAKFYVLKGAQMPSVLIEVGFISNTDEARKLKDAEYREKIAKAISDGIVDYKKRYESTEAFTR
jgi:N-acetylmuramoyl-L-alanine amidase